MRLQVRHVHHFVERHEQEWPLARTRSTRFYLDTTDRALVPKQVGEGSITYDALGEG